MSVDLNPLIEKVRKIEEVDDAVVAALKGVAQQFRDAKADQAKIEELCNRLEQSASKVSSAILENTPAATDQAAPASAPIAAAPTDQGAPEGAVAGASAGAEAPSDGSGAGSSGSAQGSSSPPT